MTLRSDSPADFCRDSAWRTSAVVFDAPGRLRLCEVGLEAPGADDLVIDVAWSGISTGTERLLWTGRMPPFPGMGYPLVPGYESVGRVSGAGANCESRIGENVFVPGARCFTDVRGLFGGAAARLVVPAARAIELEAADDERGVLLALAATAQHALSASGAVAPELIVGHGVLGRLLARLTIAHGYPPPIVWELDAARRSGSKGYDVVDPAADARADYRGIYDVSGDAGIVDSLVARLAPRGEIVLAGFYGAPLSFSFPPAFVREARLRVAAEWSPEDLLAVRALVHDGRLSLEGLVTHRSAACDAAQAYRTAFDDPECLKMVLDWRETT
jgi:3-hydroxyethyl bacteriochlorophyllide a dehydrogenase